MNIKYFKDTYNAAAQDIFAIALEQMSTYLYCVFLQQSPQTPWAGDGDPLLELSSEKGLHVHLLLIMQVSRFESWASWQIIEEWHCLFVFPEMWNALKQVENGWRDGESEAESKRTRRASSHTVFKAAGHRFLWLTTGCRWEAPSHTLLSQWNCLTL